MLIVFIGDWVKLSGLWYQVVNVNPLDDTFAVLTADGDSLWIGTKAPRSVDVLLSNNEMQERLKEAGI